jgi:WD40 repeat protein
VFSTEAAVTARRWEVADGRILFSFPWGATDPPAVLLYSRKSPHAYAAHAQGSVTRWDLNSRAVVGVGVQPTMQAASCLAVSADGRYVLCAGRDPIVRRLDLAEGKEVNRFGGHTDTVLAVAFTDEERIILSAGKDRWIHRWEFPDKVVRKIKLQTALPKDITSMVFSPDSKLLACAGYNDHEGVVILWDVEGHERNRWPMPGPVLRLVFADDSEHLATANANGTVYLYRLDRKKG